MTYYEIRVDGKRVKNGITHDLLTAREIASHYEEAEIVEVNYDKEC